MRIFQKGFNFSQDGPGNRLVYHLQGCNLRCPWCSNPEGLTLSGGTECPVEALLEEVSRSALMFFDGGGVTLTGGEVTLQLDEVRQLLHGLHGQGVNTCIETNGISPRLPELFPELDLLIMRTNDQEGTIMLSKKRVDALKGWETIVAAEESGEVLEGIVSEVIKGGLLVVSNGVRVFVPASHASLNRMEDLTPLLKQTVRFKVIEVNTARRRAVGSIRLVAREERKAQEAALWEKLEVGQHYTGVVKSLTSYGAFVDLGGVDGMIHISELSWSRIKHPSEVVKVGDTVEVYIRDLDTEKHKISLGYRKAEDNPWEIFKAKFAVGDVIDAKIVGMTTFGAFAQIIPGIDGLIHISQIADRRIDKPQDELKVGQEVKAKITNIDLENKRISLSIRALLEDAPAVEEETVAEEETAE